VLRPSKGSDESGPRLALPGHTWRQLADPYRDANGRRILETLGKEPAWNRKRAETELRRRLVDVERNGYAQPQKLTFNAFTQRWLDEYLPGRGLKFTTIEALPPNTPKTPPPRLRPPPTRRTRTPTRTDRPLRHYQDS
jgi:hypothetical protein